MAISTGMTSLLSLRNLLLFGSWSLALIGSLQIHQLGGRLGHAVCGPWGCGPPVAALIGYHTFWCLLIFPAALILRVRWCPRACRHLGVGLLIVGIVGTVALLLIDGFNNAAAETYPLRWSMFRIVTFVDFPLLQLALTGVWLRFGGSRMTNCVEAEN